MYVLLLIFVVLLFNFNPDIFIYFNVIFNSILFKNYFKNSQIVLNQKAKCLKEGQLTVVLVYICYKCEMHSYYNP